MSTTVEVFPNSGILVGAAGKRLVEAIQTAVAARGRALIVLTGGGNGTALLRYLGTQGSHIDWSKVQNVRFDEPRKVLVRRSAPPLIAALDTEKRLVDKTVLCVVPVKRRCIFIRRSIM